MKDAIERVLDNQEVQHWLSMFHFVALTYATSEVFHHAETGERNILYQMFALVWVMGIIVAVLRRRALKSGSVEG